MAFCKFHILWDNKSPFFFSRNTHNYVPILHCNHHSIQHNQDALPASNMSFSASAAFLDKTMSSPPQNCVGTFDQLKSIWNSLKAKNESPSEKVSSPKVRNIKHWGGQSEEHTDSQAHWRRVRENSQKKD